MKNESILKFNNFYVEEFVFRQNVEYQPSEDKQLKLDFDFSFGIEKKDEVFVREVTCKIFDIDFVELNKPFYIKVKICGIFSISGFDETDEVHVNIIKKNTLAILFPYIRSIISHLTMEMQLEPIILPPMNINSFFDENEDN